MIRIFSVVAIATALGALLASGVTAGPVRPVWMGVLVLLGSAWAARRYWQLQGPEHGPGSPERALWHGLASHALMTAYLTVALWRLGPAIELHSLASHAMAIDSWTLALAMLVGYAIARDPEQRHDERDEWIATSGQRAGSRTMLVLLVLLIVALTFGADTLVAQFNQPMLAHLLILALLGQHVVQQATQLGLYALDRRAERLAS